MLRKWTPSGAFFPFLTPRSLCLGPPPQSWVWMMRKAVRSSGLEALLLCSPSAWLSKMLDKFKHDFQAANLPEGKYIKPCPSTAKWYKVGQPCYEDLSKSVFLLNPLGPLWVSFPYQFLRKWNTKLGRTYPLLTLLLPLPRLFFCIFLFFILHFGTIFFFTLDTD